MKFQVTQCEPQATSAQAAQTSTLHKLHPRTGQVDPVAILERNGLPADRRVVHHGRMSPSTWARAKPRAPRVMVTTDTPALPRVVTGLTRAGRNKREPY